MPKVFRAIAVLIAVAMRASAVIQKAGGTTSRAEVVDLVCGDHGTGAAIAGNEEASGDDGVESMAGTFSSFGAELLGAIRLRDYRGDSAVCARRISSLKAWN